MKTTKLTSADIKDMSRSELRERLCVLGEYTADAKECPKCTLQRRLAIATGLIVLDA